jgi:hypothetical protein
MDAEVSGIDPYVIGTAKIIQSEVRRPLAACGGHDAPAGQHRQILKNPGPERGLSRRMNRGRAQCPLAMIGKE